MICSLAPELASIVRPGVIWWSGATVVLHEHRLDALLAEAEAKVRISPPSESVSVRTMYKKVGLDPTKTRPSNEALLRRVRKGDAIPRINSAVDVVNWCSLEFQLPYGLYDFSKVSGRAAQLMAMNGPCARGLHTCSARAKSSLPVPLSPSSSTVTSAAGLRWRMTSVPSAIRHQTPRGRWSRLRRPNCSWWCMRRPRFRDRSSNAWCESRRSVSS